jgi:hypothetical protein
MKRIPAAVIIMMGFLFLQNPAAQTIISLLRLLEPYHRTTIDIMMSVRAAIAHAIYFIPTRSIPFLKQV